jgi:hypothetical protein
MDHLSTLVEVWGDRTGYVFVPRAVRKAGHKKADYWDEGPAFEWPKDRSAIADRISLSASEGFDVYWCPLVFKETNEKRARSYRNKAGHTPTWTRASPQKWSLDRPSQCSPPKDTGRRTGVWTVM